MTLRSNVLANSIEIRPQVITRSYRRKYPRATGRVVVSWYERLQGPRGGSPRNRAFSAQSQEFESMAAAEEFAEKAS